MEPNVFSHSICSAAKIHGKYFWLIFSVVPRWFTLIHVNRYEEKLIEVNTILQTFSDGGQSPSVAGNNFIH